MLCTNLRPGASKQLLDLYADLRRRFAAIRRRRGQSMATLEDDVHDAMLVLLQIPPSFVPTNGDLRPWAWAVARNVARDRIRARVRYEARYHAEDIVDVYERISTQPSPERWAQVQQALSITLPILEKMPQPLFVVLYLMSAEGLTHAETGERLGISEDASKQRIYRAREWLAANLDIPVDELYSAMPPLLLDEAPPEPAERARQRRLLDLSRHCGFFASVLLAATLAAPRWDFVPANAGLFVPDAHISLAKAPAQEHPEPTPSRAKRQYNKPASAKLDEARLRSLTLAPEFTPSGR